MLISVSVQLPVREYKALTAKNAKFAKIISSTLCVLRALCGVLYQVQLILQGLADVRIRVLSSLRLLGIPVKSRLLGSKKNKIWIVYS
ncbi:Uncharacterised protein [uncultured archaeon]|nr:Uncharacterised protein [uncultured archaeon]